MSAPEKIDRNYPLRRFVRNSNVYEFNFNCENEHLVAAFREADRVKDDSLDNCFKRLQVIAENYKAQVTLSKDFANLSFCFSITGEDRGQSMNGGVIFHGHGGHRENNFTCTLDDNPQGWRIHT